MAPRTPPGYPNQNQMSPQQAAAFAALLAAARSQGGANWPYEEFLNFAARSGHLLLDLGEWGIQKISDLIDWIGGSDIPECNEGYQYAGVRKSDGAAVCFECPNGCEAYIGPDGETPHCDCPTPYDDVSIPAESGVSSPCDEANGLVYLGVDNDGDPVCAPPFNQCPNGMVETGRVGNYVLCEWPEYLEAKVVPLPVVQPKIESDCPTGYKEVDGICRKEKTSTKKCPEGTIQTGKTKSGNPICDEPITTYSGETFKDERIDVYDTPDVYGGDIRSHQSAIKKLAPILRR